MTTLPTVEDSLAALAAARRQVAAHRLPALQAVAEHLASFDLTALVSSLTLAADLMDAGSAKDLFVNYAKALPLLPARVDAAIAAAKAEAEA